MICLRDHPLEDKPTQWCIFLREIGLFLIWLTKRFLIGLWLIHDTLIVWHQSAPREQWFYWILIEDGSAAPPVDEDEEYCTETPTFEVSQEVRIMLDKVERHTVKIKSVFANPLLRSGGHHWLKASTLNTRVHFMDRIQVPGRLQAVFVKSRKRNKDTVSCPFANFYY